MLRFYLRFRPSHNAPCKRNIHMFGNHFLAFWAALLCVDQWKTSYCLSPQSADSCSFSTSYRGLGLVTDNLGLSGHIRDKQVHFCRFCASFSPDFALDYTALRFSLHLSRVVLHPSRVPRSSIPRTRGFEEIIGPQSWFMSGRLCRFADIRSMSVD